MGSGVSSGGLRRGVPVQPVEDVETEVSHSAEVDDVRLAFLHGTLVMDPECPLDNCQLYRLMKSWNTIKRSVCGVNLFMRLFEMYPDTKGYFPIRDFSTISEIRSSDLLAVHANKVINAIDDVFININDVDYVTLLLRVTARSHFTNLPDIDSQAFKIVEEPFILAVKEELQDKFTYSTEQIYRKAIQFAIKVLITEFNTCRANHSSAKPA